jgi:hypothetical protein
MTKNPMRGVFPLILAGFAVFAALEFLKDEPATRDSPGPAELARVADRILAVRGIGDLLATCPADIQGAWKSRAPLFSGRDRAMSEGTCARNFERCADACLEANTGDACTWVSFILETRDPSLKPAARHGYALACALGDPSGCTNRGANIRNASQEFDALSLRPRSENAACLYSTFAAACAADDAWGCAMSGQTYHRGEGVAEDRERAKSLYRRACALSGEGRDDETAKAPCRFARDLLAELEAD